MTPKTDHRVPCGVSLCLPVWRGRPTYECEVSSSRDQTHQGESVGDVGETVGEAVGETVGDVVGEQCDYGHKEVGRWADGCDLRRPGSPRAPVVSGC